MFSTRNHIRMLLAVCLAAAACLAVAPVASTKKQLVRATLCLLNKQRGAHHMGRLRLSKGLGVAARGHSAEMARVHYFSHSSRSGASFLDRIRRAGYLRRAHRWSVGENIAWAPVGCPPHARSCAPGCTAPDTARTSFSAAFATSASASPLARRSK